MTNEQAKAILQCMADGIDPITGEILETNHLCNSPEIIRALYTAIHALSASDPKAVPPSPKAEKLNAGRPWTDEDLDALDLMYSSGESMEVICRKLQRRERGVLKQLIYLGLIEDEKSPSKEPTPGLERAGLRWTHEEDTLLKDLYIEKWTIPEISVELQRSEYSIFCRMEKLKLFGEEYGYPASNESSWRNDDNRELRDMFQTGKPIDEIASHFGRSEKSIQARLFYMGLSKESPMPVLRKKS